MKCQRCKRRESDNFYDIFSERFLCKKCVRKLSKRTSGSLRIVRVIDDDSEKSCFGNFDSPSIPCHLCKLKSSCKKGGGDGEKKK